MPALSPASRSARRSVPRGPGKVLFPVVIGLALLAWVLELGQGRRRAPVAGDPGGPLVEVPAASPEVSP